MNYSDLTTEKLESLKSSIEERLDTYVGMSFASPRSEFVTYEIDSVASDEVVITANHFFDGLLRDYTVTIDRGVDDDVEYNLYNTDEEIVDGGYMSFDRLPKDVRNAVCEISSLYKEIEKLDNILNTRAEESEEDAEEEKFEELESLYSNIEEKFEDLESLYSAIEEKFEGLKNSFSILKNRAEESEEEEEVMTKSFYSITVKRVIPQLYEVSYRGHHITDLIKTDYGDWKFAGFFMKEYNGAIYSLLATVFDMRFKTKKQATIELEGTFAKFEVAKDELGI